MARKPKTAPILETDRLRLRPFRAGDLKALHALYGDAGNLRYWGHDPTGSLDETRRMMRWHVAYHPSHYVLWAVEALIRPENKPSVALAKRLGFRLEGGPIRDRWLVGGRWHSVMLYGLIAGEER